MVQKNLHMETTVGPAGHLLSVRVEQGGVTSVACLTDENYTLFICSKCLHRFTYRLSRISVTPT